MVGDADRVYLPDIGRQRAGAGRFRGLRLIRTVLDRDGELDRDDLTDLSRLQLDLVAAVGVAPGGYPGSVEWAHLLPDNPEGKTWEVQKAPNPAELDFNFERFIAELESEFQRKAVDLVTTGGQPALLIYVSTPNDRGVDTELAEMRELCRTAGVDVIDTVVQKRSRVHPKYAVGSGKLEDIILRALQLDVDLLIFGQDLTPGQLRNITERTDYKVIDRTQLILDIFAQHAKSADGKLQVELAQLKYNLPRLNDKYTGMSRLTGGIGGRGPGETKLEINRRRARDRIRRLEKDIDKLSQQRELRRKRRVDNRIPIVSIVGYTNAGKSTLLNKLTDSDVVSENKLFATLSPTTRRLRFPDEREIVFTDTVGFIHELPPDLVTAFKATLEELEEADVLIHVVDASEERFPERIEAVNGILDELELDDKQQILVFNKADLLPDGEAAAIARQYDGAVAISALDRDTVVPVVEELETRLFEQSRRHQR
jgi:GTP-binding protein HflX